MPPGHRATHKPASSREQRRPPAGTERCSYTGAQASKPSPQSKARLDFTKSSSPDSPSGTAQDLGRGEGFTLKSCGGETTVQARARALTSALRERPVVTAKRTSPYRADNYSVGPSCCSRCPTRPGVLLPGTSAPGPRFLSHPRSSGIPSKQAFAQNLKPTKPKHLHTLWSLNSCESHRPPASEGPAE